MAMDTPPARRNGDSALGFGSQRTGSISMGSVTHELDLPVPGWQRDLDHHEVWLPGRCPGQSPWAQPGRQSCRIECSTDSTETVAWSTTS